MYLFKGHLGEKARCDSLAFVTHFGAACVNVQVRKVFFLWFCFLIIYLFVYFVRVDLLNYSPERENYYVSITHNEEVEETKQLGSPLLLISGFRMPFFLSVC